MLLLARVGRSVGYPNVSTLTEKRRKGLRNFWFDGLFSSMANGFADPYYALYMLSLGSSNALIGLVNTLNQAASATLALPGAAVADRSGRYKQIAVRAGIVARLMWPVMFMAPWLLPDQAAVWTVLFAWVTISASGAFANAAWTALTADLVPVRLRGGYFASRNIVMAMVRLGSVPLAGLIVNEIGEPQGFQVNLTLAFAISLISLAFYRALPEHPPSAHIERLGMRQALREMKHLPVLLRFTLTHATLNFGAMLAAPFLSVYMVQEAHFSVGTIGLIATVNTFASLLAMRTMGRLHDRFGMIRTMRFGFAIPLIPVLWLFVSHPWQGFLVEAMAAATWAGYNLGAFNLLLASTPNEHRPHYIAIYNTIISIVGAAAPLLGGALLDAVGFAPVFLLSFGVRALGLVLFVLLVGEPEPPPEPEDDDL